MDGQCCQSVERGCGDGRKEAYFGLTEEVTDVNANASYYKTGLAEAKIVTS